MDDSDLTDFEKVNEHSGIEKFQKEVNTPSSVEHVEGPDAVNPRGSNYATEENNMTVYVVREADLMVKVAKVGTKGWSTSQYTLDGELLDTGGPYYDAEGEAHGEAKTTTSQEAL